MSWGKILGGIAIGVGAVAAAPFTGGGSILGAATALGSLAGAGTVAAAVGAGAAGAAIGASLSEDEENKKKELERQVVNAQLKANNFENIANEHSQHTKLIIALSALGMAMANADGYIDPIELQEIDEVVGGLSSKKYPSHIIEKIRSFRNDPPSFGTALNYLDDINSIEYPEIRNLLVCIMDSDDFQNQKEKAFLAAFDRKVASLN